MKRNQHFVLTALTAICLCFLWNASAAAQLTREGRKLLWNDKPIQLVGYSYYGLMGDRQFDADAFLETIAAHNINYTRFFVILPWPVEPGPNMLPFAENNGKYDLRRFDQAFFDRLSAVVTKAEKLGIICQVCLFDRCGLSVDDRGAWPNNPYNAKRNINGLLKGPARGYPPFCHATGPIAEINAALIEKVVEVIGDRKNVLYEVINEPYAQLGPLEEWHGWVAAELLKHLKSRQGSKVISSTGPYDDKQIDLFSMHTASRDHHVESAIRRSLQLNRPVILSDDGDAACMYNPAVTRMALKRALKLGQHFEHLEFMIAQQREQDHRRASRLEEMPGLCLENLRMISRLATPLLDRPYVRTASVRREAKQFVFSAELRHADKAARVIGQHSSDGGRSWKDLPATAQGSKVTVRDLPSAAPRNLVRVVCTDGQSRRWPGPVYSYTATDRWSIHLGEKFSEAGLIRVRPFWSDGTTERSTRAGQACYQTVPKRRGTYAYFRVDDTFPRAKQSLPVTITIRYFDDAKGSKLQLEYDSAAGAYTAAKPITLQGSGQWKTVSLRIEGATFRGRQNDGADLRFMLDDPKAPLAIRSVSVDLAK